MIPFSLEPKITYTQNRENLKIVIFTGNKIRHKRFAYKIYNRFPDNVVKWYEIESLRNNTNDSKLRGRNRKKINQFFYFLFKNPKLLLFKVREYLIRVLFNSANEDSELTELNFFKFENDIFYKVNELLPCKISDPNTEEVYKELFRIKPFLIVTLGGAKYSKKLTDYATGAALNQHDGWCPEYRGSNTIEWTLFYRDYSRLGSTIHIITKDMDAGDIIRRSTICPSPKDSIYECFLRSIALGTELMIESISEILLKKEIHHFPQENNLQRTFLNRDLNMNVKNSIERDFKMEIYYKAILNDKKF